MPSTFGLGAVLPRIQWSSGSPPPAWSIDTDSPTFGIDIPRALANGNLWQNTGKTTAATSLTHPIGALVPQWGSPDYIQGTGSRQPTITAVGANARITFDGGDDILQPGTGPALAAGEKTLCFRIRQPTLLGATDIDGLMTIGDGTRQFRVNLSGSSNSTAGLNFCFDLTSATNVTWLRLATYPLDTSSHTVVIYYNGGTITSAASYEAWVDSSPVAISSGLAGNRLGSQGAIGATPGLVQVASLELNKILLWTADKRPNRIDIEAYAGST